jgi:hypothetical protein
MFGIEVSLPPGWARVPSNDPDSVTFVGPSQLGYRPMLVLSEEDADQPIADSVESLLVSYALASPGYERLSERTVEIDGCWAYVEHHRWDGEAGVRVTQLLGVIALEPGRVLKLDGVCLTDLESRHLPLLDQIATSVTTAGPAREAAAAGG